MTTKTKKIITLVTASAMALTASLTIPKTYATASADTMPYYPYASVEGVRTSGSYFGTLGLKYFAYADVLQETEGFYYELPFAPWVPWAVDEGFSMGDGSLYSAYEDISANHSVRYDCYYDEPTYADDGGIIDDGVPCVYPSFYFNIDTSRSSACSIGLSVDGYWVCDYLSFDNLPFDFHIDGGGAISPRKTISFSYYSDDGEWIDVRQTTTSSGDYYQLHNFLNQAYTIIKGGREFCLIRDYKYTCQVTSDYASITCEGAPYVFTDGVEPPLITEFTTTIINEPPPPVDIGDMLWQPVESFLKTEFIPDFTFGDMCLLALGLLLFGVFLKTFLGG